MRQHQDEPESRQAARVEAEAESSEDSGEAAAAGDDAQAARDALEQRYAEQLLDDESLRADLTDEEFAPLEAWALDLLHARVQALADPEAEGTEEALGAAVESLRAVLRAANDTLGQRFDLDEHDFAEGLSAIREALGPELYGAEGPADQAERTVEAVVPGLAARKDEDDGAPLAEELAAALRSGTEWQEG
jgi:hypothetical protein